ncbi:MAG: ABC transporter permease [Lachnospiraceae bacterium]
MLHIIYYRILSTIRNKMDIFWALCFPIILGTCFFAAFSDIYKMDFEFESIPIAAVLEENSQLKNVLDTLSNQGMEEDSEPMLKVNYTNMAEAEKMLNEKKVIGIIEENEGVHLSVNENGLEATFLQSFLDQYVQTMYVIGNAGTDDISEILKIVENLQSNADTSNLNAIQNKQISSADMNPYTDYYYALIAMACLYACFSGLTCAKQMKADISSLGMRKCLVSTGRMKMIVGDMLGCYVIQCISNVLLIFYLQYVLGIDLGNRLPLILFTAFMGSLIGLAMGIFIGSIPKLSDGIKTGIALSVSMLSCFLSGLMVGGLRWLIEFKAPIINRLNPATVLTDALYALNIYDTYERFTGNLLILFIMSVVLCSLSFFMVRRECYEQL